MKRFDRKIPIGARIGGSIIAVVGLVVVFMVMYFPAQQNRLALDALKMKTTVVASIVSSELAPALDFDDMEVIHEALKGMTLDEDVIFAALYDGNGKRIAQVYAATNQGRGAGPWVAQINVRPLTTPEIIEHENALEVHFPLSTPGGKKGTLVSGFSLMRLKSDTAQAKQTTLLVALVLMACGLLAAYLLGRSIGRRVSKVVDAAERVARGEITRVKIDDDIEDEIGAIVQSFNAMNANLLELSERVNQVAKGDLSVVAGVEGQLADAFNMMIMNQRELVRQISGTATQLNAAAGEFFANAKQQARGATNQSTAVEQVRHTLETLLTSAREIGETATSVLRSAEQSQRNSQNVAEKIAALSNQTRSITEILEVIKDIANKSDLLALNAGLEGTKAGEAGRGFSLVASQMQRLAENVMGAVRDIKELTTTIAESTEATVLATEESTKLATDTTRSAQQIGLTIRQQQSGTEQAVTAMIDVGEVASQTAAGSKEIVASATDLMSLSEQLQALVGRFRVEQDTRPSERNAAE